MSLFDAIEALAVKLAYEVLAALGDATLDDVLVVGGRAAAVTSPRSRALRRPPVRAGREGRTSQARGALDDVAAKAIAVLRRSPEGLRTETLRTLVGAPKAAYQRAMLKLVGDGLVSKSGSKRATTYRAG
jgi:hypothetical protein